MALRLHAHGIVFHVYFSWKTRPASTLLLFRNSSPKYIFHTSKKDLFFLRHTFSSLLKWEKVGGLWEMGSKIGFLSHAVPLPITVVMMEKMSNPGYSPTKFSTPQSHLIWGLFGSYLVLYLFYPRPASRCRGSWNYVRKCSIRTKEFYTVVCWPMPSY